MSESNEMSTSVTVRFTLTKGEGEWPMRYELSESEIENPSLFCFFNLVVEGDLEVEIKSCKVIYDGVTFSKLLGLGLVVSETAIGGYPSPIIKFLLSEPVDQQDFVRSVWLSTVSLRPLSREIKNIEPFFCEDMNGLTEYLSASQVEEINRTLAQEGLYFGKSFNLEELQFVNMHTFAPERH